MASRARRARAERVAAVSRFPRHGFARDEVIAAKDAIGGMVSRVEGSDTVDVRTGVTVTNFDGESGDFTARLSDDTTVDASAAILCTGFTHFDSVNKPEWGFGTFPDVVTTTQVEEFAEYMVTLYKEFTTSGPATAGQLQRRATATGGKTAAGTDGAGLHGASSRGDAPSRGDALAHLARRG